jgi:putative FmdB family regulatory protein
MPIYEYRCTKCHHEFEAMQKFSDEPLSTCPDCGGRAKRLISRSSFQLKGSGWYLTDYARKGSSGPQSGGSGESGTSEKGPSAEASPKPSVTEGGD